MPIDLINAIGKLLHELGPWAGVAIAAIAAWQSKRAKDYSKENRQVIETAAQTIEVTKTKVEEAQQKLEEVHNTVNGRVDQLVDIAKKQGYQEAAQEIQQNGK